MPGSWPLILDGSRLNTFLGLRFPRARFPIASPTPAPAQQHTAHTQWGPAVVPALTEHLLTGRDPGRRQHLLSHNTQQGQELNRDQLLKSHLSRKPQCGPRSVRASSPGPGTQQVPPCVGSSFPSHSQGLHLRLGSPHIGDDPRKTL